MLLKINFGKSRPGNIGVGVKSKTGTRLKSPLILTSITMVVGEVGSVLVGIVFGWTLVHTAYEKEWDWKAYVAVLAAVVGGSGVDYMFKTSYVGYFWIGIFAGFIANLLIRLTKKKPIFRDPPVAPGISEGEGQMDLIKNCAIQELQVWLEDMPMEQRKEVAVYLGQREFTPDGLLTEMQQNGEYGHIIAQMIYNHGKELAMTEPKLKRGVHVS